MSGRLALSTPWAREGIAREDIPTVEATIPDGATLGVSVESNRARWILWLVYPGQDPEWRMKVSHRVPLAKAIAFALERHAAPA